jgi:hypothetical protein
MVQWHVNAKSVIRPRGLRSPHGQQGIGLCWYHAPPAAKSMLAVGIHGQLCWGGSAVARPQKALLGAAGDNPDNSSEQFHAGIDKISP